MKLNFNDKIFEDIQLTYLNAEAIIDTERFVDLIVKTAMERSIASGEQSTVVIGRIVNDREQLIDFILRCVTSNTSGESYLREYLTNLDGIKYTKLVTSLINEDNIEKYLTFMGLG